MRQTERLYSNRLGVFLTLSTMLLLYTVFRPPEGGRVGRWRTNMRVRDQNFFWGRFLSHHAAKWCEPVTKNWWDRARRRFRGRRPDEKKWMLEFMSQKWKRMDGWWRKGCCCVVMYCCCCFDCCRVEKWKRERKTYLYRPTAQTSWSIKTCNARRE